MKTSFIFLFASLIVLSSIHHSVVASARNKKAAKTIAGKNKMVRNINAIVEENDGSDVKAKNESVQENDYDDNDDDDENGFKAANDYNESLERENNNEEEENDMDEGEGSGRTVSSPTFLSISDIFPLCNISPIGRNRTRIRPIRYRLSQTRTRRL